MRILQQDRILLCGEAPETVCVRQQNKLYLTFHQNGGEYIPTTVERLSFHSLISLFLGGLRCQGVSGFGACVWHLCYWRATWQLRSRPSLSLCEYRAVLLRRGGVIQCPAADRCGVVGDICSSTAKSPHHMVLFMHNLLHIPAMWKKSPDTHKLCPNDNRGNTITGNTFTTNHALSPQWLVLHANQNW